MCRQKESHKEDTRLLGVLSREKAMVPAKAAPFGRVFLWVTPNGFGFPFGFPFNTNEIGTLQKGHTNLRTKLT